MTSLKKFRRESENTLAVVLASSDSQTRVGFQSMERIGGDRRPMEIMTKIVLKRGFSRLWQN